MKAIKLALMTASLALFVAACSSSVGTGNGTNTASTVSSPVTAPTTEAPVDELASAKKIYSEKCIKCHKEDGKGGVTDIDGEKIKVPDLTAGHAKKHEDSEFIEMIENGDSDEGMPSFKGKISDDDIKSLVKLIRRDFQKL